MDKSELTANVQSDGVKNAVGQTLTRFVGAYAAGSMNTGALVQIRVVTKMVFAMLLLKLRVIEQTQWAKNFKKNANGLSLKGC
jgi:hypothetical protein